jgi:hypothetical protein
VASVMGLLEERERAARVRVEEFQAEADRILAELGEAEKVLDRRSIARAELVEALSAPGVAAHVPVLEAEGPVPMAKAVKVPAAGSIVPRRGEGMRVEVLAPDYRRIVSLLESEPGDGEGVLAKEIAARLGLELVPTKIEGVRSKAKCLAGRGWLAMSPSGRFMPRQPIGSVPASVHAGGPGGRGGGS